MCCCVCWLLWLLLQLPVEGSVMEALGGLSSPPEVPGGKILRVVCCSGVLSRCCELPMGQPSA